MSRVHCVSNLSRSQTAELHFTGRPGIATLIAGAGLYAVRPLTAELMAWADLILTMDAGYADKVREHFEQALGGIPTTSLDAGQIQTERAEVDRTARRAACALD